MQPDDWKLIKDEKTFKTILEIVVESADYDIPDEIIDNPKNKGYKKRYFEILKRR
jgi:hypothetical protein